MCRNRGSQTGPIPSKRKTWLIPFQYKPFQVKGSFWRWELGARKKLPKEQDSVDRIRKALEEARRWVGEDKWDPTIYMKYDEARNSLVSCLRQWVANKNQNPCDSDTCRVLFLRFFPSLGNSWRTTAREGQRKKMADMAVPAAAMFGERLIFIHLLEYIDWTCFSPMPVSFSQT